MSLENFSKFFGKYAPVVNAGDIQLVHNGKYQSKRIRELGEEYLMPEYEVVNPKNVPYTEAALTGYMHEEIGRFKNFIDPGIRNYNLYVLDCDEIYIPIKNFRNVEKCVVSKDFDKPKEIRGVEYRVIGSYSDDISFKAEDENVLCYVGFKLHKVTKRDKEGRIVELNRKDAEDVFHYINQDESEFFENKIWDCFRDNFMTGHEKTFVDFDWMGWYTFFELID